MFQDYSFRFEFIIAPRGLGIPFIKLAISLFRIGFNFYGSSDGYTLELLCRGKCWYICKRDNPAGYIKPEDKYTIWRLWFGIKIMNTHAYYEKQGMRDGGK